MSYEYKLDIAGVTYGMHDISSVTIEQPLFEKVSIGNTCMAKMDVTLWPIGDIPKNAKIIPYCREIGTEKWTQLGVFFIMTRQEKESRRSDLPNALSIVAYDVMLKSDTIWVPRQDLPSPMTMETAAKEIAGLMGTSLDKRCVFNSSYKIDDLNVNEYSYRDILAYIATAHAGNWIATATGQLLMIPLYGSMPPETHYLIEEHGSAITFGGVRILI